MIYVTRLNGKPFVINSNLIETMEETPDTVITLTGGNKYVVAESMDILIERIIEFQQRCHLNPQLKNPQPKECRQE